MRRCGFSTAKSSLYVWKLSILWCIGGSLTCNIDSSSMRTCLHADISHIYDSQNFHGGHCYCKQLTCFLISAAISSKVFRPRSADGDVYRLVSALAHSFVRCVNKFKFQFPILQLAKLLPHDMVWVGIFTSVVTRFGVHNHKFCRQASRISYNFGS